MNKLTIMPYGKTPNSRTNFDHGSWPFYIAHSAEDGDWGGWCELILDHLDNFGPNVNLSIYGLPKILELKKALTINEGYFCTIQLENEFQRIELARYGNRLHITIYTTEIIQYKGDENPSVIQWRFAFQPSPEQVEAILKSIETHLAYFNHVPTGKIEFERM